LQASSCRRLMFSGNRGTTVRVANGEIFIAWSIDYLAIQS
jgi:hypothetical protein